MKLKSKNLYALVYNGKPYIAFGLIGRALASGGYEATYDMTIDPITGVFVHLRKIQTPEQGL